MILRVFAVVLSCVPIYAQQAKPVLSTEPISSERMEIYRDFFSKYNNGSGSAVNIGNETVEFIPKDYEVKGCLKAFAPADLKTSVTHTFSADAFPESSAHLVDARKHKQRDPGNAIKHGQSVEDAVRAGFAAGIFTFSEIAFDSSHTHAAFTYSFVCGSLCGSGETVVSELKEGKWKSSKKQGCGSWIS